MTHYLCLLNTAPLPPVITDSLWPIMASTGGGSICSWGTSLVPITAVWLWQTNHPYQIYLLLGEVCILLPNSSLGLWKMPASTGGKQASRPVCHMQVTAFWGFSSFSYFIKAQFLTRAHGLRNLGWQNVPKANTLSWRAWSMLNLPW